MEIINHIDYLAGKTIKEARFDDITESLCLIFNDETYAVIVVAKYGDSFDMEMCDGLDYQEKEGFGLLTDDEITEERERKEADVKARKEREANYEIAELKRLKAKYSAA